MDQTTNFVRMENTNKHLPNISNPQTCDIKPDRQYIGQHVVHTVSNNSEVLQKWKHFANKETQVNLTRKSSHSISTQVDMGTKSFAHASTQVNMEAEKELAIFSNTGLRQITATTYSLATVDGLLKQFEKKPAQRQLKSSPKNASESFPADGFPVTKDLISNKIINSLSDHVDLSSPCSSMNPEITSGTCSPVNEELSSAEKSQLIMDCENVDCFIDLNSQSSTTVHRETTSASNSGVMCLKLNTCKFPDSMQEQMSSADYKAYPCINTIVTLCGTRSVSPCHRITDEQAHQHMEEKGQIASPERHLTERFPMESDSCDQLNSYQCMLDHDYCKVSKETQIKVDGSTTSTCFQANAMMSGSGNSIDKRKPKSGTVTSQKDLPLTVTLNVKPVTDTNTPKTFFICKCCGERFGSRNEFRAHCEKHTGEKKHVCSTCGKGFIKPEFLENHIFVHTGDKPYKCKLCDKRFAGETLLKMHERVNHREISLKCEFCHKIFPGECSLNQHRRLHTGEKPHGCKVCGKKFRTAKNLRDHMQTHKTERPFMCDTCGKTFKGKKELMVHKNTHNKEKPFICETCGKKYKTAGSLREHSLSHSDIAPKYTCPVCEKGFHKLYVLERHKFIHTGLKPFQCDICNKTFALHGNFLLHKQRHTGNKSHFCETCGKGFFQSSALRKHIRTHTGEKPEICKTCGKGFRQTSQLRVHNRIHTGERPYVCEKCGKGFITKSKLNRHVTTHIRRISTHAQNYFACEICGEGFQDNSSLIIHRQKHQIEPQAETYTCISLEDWM